MPRRTVRRLVLALAAAAALSTVAAADASAGAPATVSLPGTSWRLNGFRVDDGMKPAVKPGVLVFDRSGGFGGSTGCNRFAGTYEVRKRQVVLDITAVSKMACTPDVAVQEEAVLAGLDQTVTPLAGKGGNLRMVDGKGRPVLIWRPAADPLLDTAWRITKARVRGEVVDIVDAGAYVTFPERGTASGYTGCNDFGAHYTLPAQGLITFEDIWSTKRLCDGLAGDADNAILWGLPAVTRYAVVDNQLNLLDAKGETVLVAVGAKR